MSAAGDDLYGFLSDDDGEYRYAYLLSSEIARSSLVDLECGSRGIVYAQLCVLPKIKSYGRTWSDDSNMI